MALSKPQLISRMMLDRIGQSFDEEAHFSGDEVRTIAAAITALETEVERADDVRDTLVTTLRAVDMWAKAYPTEVFVEPDFAEVRRLLGSTLLSQVSASNMRHVLTGVAGLVAHALASIESKP